METIKIDSLSVNNKDETFHRCYHLKCSNLSNKPSLKLFAYTLGLFVSFIYYGIIQEDVVTDKYGKKEEIISHALTIKCCESIVCVIVAGIFTYFTATPQGIDTTKSAYYIVISLFILVSKCCEVTALNYVNFQALVINKSCKPLPMMIFGAFIARKNYNLQKYLFVSMIVVGELIFVYEKPSDIDDEACKGPIVGPGEILIMCSLMLDGVYGAVQDLVRAEQQSKWNHLMLSINSWSTLLGGIYLLVTNKGLSFVNFLRKYPNAVEDIAILSFTSALGQIFIYNIVAEFGSLVCCIISNIRKVCTLVASSIIFGDVMNLYQIFGTIVIFAGILLDSYF